jgi:hypothetical protein
MINERLAALAALGVFCSIIQVGCSSGDEELPRGQGADDDSTASGGSTTDTAGGNTGGSDSGFQPSDPGSGGSTTNETPTTGTGGSSATPATGCDAYKARTDLGMYADMEAGENIEDGIWLPGVGTMGGWMWRMAEGPNYTKLIAPGYCSEMACQLTFGGSTWGGGIGIEAQGKCFDFSGHTGISLATKTNKASSSSLVVQVVTKDGSYNAETSAPVGDWFLHELPFSSFLPGENTTAALNPATVGVIQVMILGAEADILIDQLAAYGGTATPAIADCTW